MRNQTKTIQWTPWFNVALHRRLEVLSAAVAIFFVLGFHIVAVPILLYVLVNMLSHLNI